jgi:hypothetical protein
MALDYYHLLTFAVAPTFKSVVCNFLNHSGSNTLFSDDSAMLIHFAISFIAQVDKDYF